MRAGRVGARRKVVAMLLVLTGAIQSGKTRWLQRLVGRAEAMGVPVSGVLAPGVWERDARDVLVKTGIDNLLLPQGQTVHFGTRRPAGETSQPAGAGPARPAAPAGRGGRPDAGDAGARAGLSWVIPDQAVAQVNAHLDGLVREARASRRRAQAGEPTGPGMAGPGDTSGSGRAPQALADTGGMLRGGLLVIDELGRLELERGEGISSALELLALGPTPAFPVALVVVREQLLDKARELLAPAWGEVRPVLPDRDGEELLAGVLASLGENGRLAEEAREQARDQGRDASAGSGGASAGRRGAPADRREELLDAACRIAREHGIAAVTVRGVAAACGVSVGGVYRHFPNKSELTAAAAERHFSRAFRDDFCRPEPGERFVDYARRMRVAMLAVFEEFRRDWMRGDEAIPRADLAAAKRREGVWVGHVHRALTLVLERDSQADISALPAGVAARDVAGAVLDAVVDEVRGESSAEVILWALERALYR